MAQTTIAIIGVGPRGLGILERLLAIYKGFPDSGKIEILLIDPNQMGAGVHSTKQPDHLLVNTVACQITMFGDDTLEDLGSIRRGPIFFNGLTVKAIAILMENFDVYYLAGKRFMKMIICPVGF